jgi:hypothetical protein
VNAGSPHASPSGKNNTTSTSGGTNPPSPGTDSTTSSVLQTGVVVVPVEVAS